MLESDPDVILLDVRNEYETSVRILEAGYVLALLRTHCLI